MKTTKRSVQAFIFVLAATANLSFAAPPNTTPTGIVSYEVGQGWVTHYFDESATNRWFSFGAVGGHSYCIEAVQGPVSPVQLDPNLTVYTDVTGGTVYAPQGVALTNDNGAGDPYQIKGARTCFIAQAAGTTVVRSFKVNVPIIVGSGDAGYVKLRVVDTTLIAQAFVNYSGYPATVWLSNLSTTSINVSYGFGTPLFGTATQAAPGLASTWLALTTSQYSGPRPFYIAHDGPPGSLRGFAYFIDPQTGITRNVDFLPR